VASTGVARILAAMHLVVMICKLHPKLGMKVNLRPGLIEDGLLRVSIIITYCLIRSKQIVKQPKPHSLKKNLRHFQFEADNSGKKKEKGNQGSTTIDNA
jgi:hypothetical protein